MKQVLFYIVLLFVVSCEQVPQDVQTRVDELNDLSYRNRYIDIDSTLSYAKQALSASHGYADGHAAAECNLAFVAYQQMHYDQALHILRNASRGTRNQIVLLCVDVLRMKVAQRIGDGRTFFTSRERALNRLSRVDEEYKFLSPAEVRHVEYARSELHLVSGTYYYYLGQDSVASSEIKSINPDVLVQKDTAQFYNYEYLMGCCHVITGDSLDVALKEYDYLINVYTQSRLHKYMFFEANALQALAVTLSQKSFRDWIKVQRPVFYEYLLSQHLSWMPVGFEPEEGLSIALANHSLKLFLAYKDLYQTASVHSTLGDLYFQHEMYSQALHQYLSALHHVESQRSRSHSTVTPWVSNIYQHLSLAYSALNDKPASDYYRNAYLDLLDSSRQDIELDTRKTELVHELQFNRIRVGVLLLLMLLSTILAVILARRLRSRSIRNMDNLLQIRQSDAYQQMQNQLQQAITDVEDKIEESNEAVQMSQMHIDEYKSGNAERRAKVSLVYSVVPYLDRMLDSVHRMQKGNEETVGEHLEYVGELSREIMHINSVLTDWIQMKQGQLSLHVSVFSLQTLLDIIARGKHSFEQKNVFLRVDHTDVQVRADETLTLFMINTLADNARKFTPSGGTVRIDVKSADEYVEVGISDTGIGMSPEDVETLNTSKVYDPSKLGISQENKGFGFGIMNCKGIIGKYRKVSSLFNVCDFGVTSEVGKGSRFWFRLPRVLSMLICLIACTLGSAHTTKEFYDSVYNANVAGHYEDAMRYGNQALQEITAPMDTFVVMNLHNEMAIAALALHQWDAYDFHNNECVRLHRLYTSDNSLEQYCQEMTRLKADSKALYVLLVLLSLIALVLFYFLFLRDRIHSEHIVQYLQDAYKRMFAVVTPNKESTDVQSEVTAVYNEINQHVQNFPKLVELTKELRSDIVQKYNELDKSRQQLENAQEQSERTKFEEDRLYVMNQILDNSLSTIKHETMYYPARVQQMVDLIMKDGLTNESLSELQEFITYYREVYLLLYHQAECQLEQNSFHRTDVALGMFLPSVEKRIKHLIQRAQSGCSFDLHSLSPLEVIADSELLSTMLVSLIQPTLNEPCQISLSVDSQGNQAEFSLRFIGLYYTPDKLMGLFEPSTEHIPYLIARQILREHDAYSGNPGLRLFAQSEADGCSIIFTLLLANK